MVKSLPRRLLTVALVVALTGASSAIAQSPRPTYDPADIQKRIERSSDLQRQALRSLGDLTSAEQLVRRAYDELQAAQSALIINATGQKFQDPLLDINTRKAQEAMNLLQRASDTIRINQGAARPGLGGQANQDSSETTVGTPGYVDTVRTSIEHALRLTITLIVF